MYVIYAHLLAYIPHYSGCLNLLEGIKISLSFVTFRPKMSHKLRVQMLYIFVEKFLLLRWMHIKETEMTPSQMTGVWVWEESYALFLHLQIQISFWSPGTSIQ
jgi:hypothetical protein